MAQLEPALVALEEVMQNLRAVLDARVFVSLGRGLWDCTAREVFDYTEELQEEHHKVGHISHVSVVAERCWGLTCCLACISECVFLVKLYTDCALGALVHLPKPVKQSISSQPAHLKSLLAGVPG